MVLAEVHHSVRAPRHLLQHETCQALEVHDEAAHGGGSHHFGAATGSTQASLLLFPPGVDSLKVGRTQHQQKVQLCEQHLIVPSKLSIHIPAPVARRVLQALQPIDRRLELISALRTRAYAPAFEDHQVAPALPGRPLCNGMPLVLRLVEPWQRDRFPLAQATKDPYPELHVVRSRHAAGGKQRMNRVRPLETVGSGQIDVVQRKDCGAQPVHPLQEPLQQPSQGRLPGPLRPVQPKHQGRILDVVRDPRGHRQVEIGNECVRWTADSFFSAPGLDVGTNVGKLRAKPTAEGEGPKHWGIISSSASENRDRGRGTETEADNGTGAGTGSDADTVAVTVTVPGAAPVLDVNHPPMPQPKIRILVAKPGLDGHDRGAKVVARALRDAGFEVIYTGLHQTPDMVAVAAIQEDVDAVGLSIMSGAHNTLFPAVLDALSARGADDIIVFGGGIVPEADAESLLAKGVGAIFTPGAALEEIVGWIRAHVKPRSLET